MSDFFDDEIEENNNSHLLLADIEWSSQSDPFDISVDSFSLNIVNRLSGIDEDKFKEEVEMWQQVIGNLPAYNEAKLKNEMNAWDFTIPKHDNFSFDMLEQTAGADLALLWESLSELPDAEAILNSIFKVKVEFNATAYKKLLPTVQDVINPYIVVKEASPSLELVAPKEVK
jgi:hypothetical protein